MGREAELLLAFIAGKFRGKVLGLLRYARVPSQSIVIHMRSLLVRVWGKTGLGGAREPLACILGRRTVGSSHVVSEPTLLRASHCRRRESPVWCSIEVIGGEAAICETRSQLFRGLCFRNDNCSSVCEKEGYLTGRCKGFLLRCICAKDCGAGDPKSGGGSPPEGGGDGGGSPPEGGDDGPPGGPMKHNMRSMYKIGKSETKG
ncbi:hypothetical protein BUALT_Bualt18G0088700 [Buddleja alternifolia]|uniref:Knottins-like domain-containing protein n=1 Tax=Buddleja alternifolia TaxID=168488 RepID=A0AAV6W4N0_9LAMI|nr:hypothetical protein BUALT_Bualt18G0088700 [Buddleja alternifolia]